MFGEFLGRHLGLPDRPGGKRPDFDGVGACFAGAVSGGRVCSFGWCFVFFDCSGIRDSPMFIGVPPDTTGEIEFSGEAGWFGRGSRDGFPVFIFTLISG